MLVPTRQITGAHKSTPRVDYGGPSTSSEDLNEVKKFGAGKKGEIAFQNVVDNAQLDAGKQALRALLKDRKTKKKKKASCVALIRLYITILAGLMIIGGLFVLLFLVPMTIDPALATLTYEFHPDPVLCMTTFAEWIVGQANITWCSCTEGCTSDIYNCSQITVVYRDCVMRNASELLMSEEGECEIGDNGTLANTTYIDPAHWDVLNGSLFINVKGCGYPPYVNCSTFFDDYGVPGRRFWCYYSKMDPYLVMPDYDPLAAESELIQSLGWTVGAQVLGVFIIIFLHCPWMATVKNMCRKKSALQPEGAAKGDSSTINPTAMKGMVAAWRDKSQPRQPVFQRDWYDVHT